MNAITPGHWAVVKASLAEVRKAEARRLTIDEAAFLPAAIEVIERPVSPTARLTAKVMMAGVATLALWLTIGQTEIVASAPGRIVPAGQVQLVQPAQAGIVRRILVHDGDHVTKGQPLVLLDPTVSTAEAAQAAKAWEAAAFEVARTRAVIDSLDGKGFSFVAPEGVDPAAIPAQRALASARLAEVEAAIAAAASGGAVARADIAAAQAEVAKINKSLPLLDQQIAANEELLAKGYVSKLKVMEMRRQRIAEAGNRDAAIAAIARARAQASGAATSTGKSRADMRAQLYTDLVKAMSDADLRREEMVKAQQKSSQQALRAPVTGTVGQLALHTEGGVVEPAKPIMTVVPSNERLIAEVRLLNRDAGFVSPGQRVSVKLDAFPFSRYGMVSGRVLSISPDAVDDEKMGPVYIVRVALERTTIDRGDRAVPITPGMTATADIVTGTRSYLSYLTSPVLEAGSSALRER